MSLNAFSCDFKNAFSKTTLKKINSLSDYRLIFIISQLVPVFFKLELLGLRLTNYIQK